MYCISRVSPVLDGYDVALGLEGFFRQVWAPIISLEMFFLLQATNYKPANTSNLCQLIWANCMDKISYTGWNFLTKYQK